MAIVLDRVSYGWSIRDRKRRSPDVRLLGRTFSRRQVFIAAAAPFASCWGFLLDAAHERLHGGTGEPWRWERAAGALPGRRVLVAGGVAPGRVRELAGRLGARAGHAGVALPWGLDVCSGVESAPGVKDEARMRALFAEVRDVEISTVA